MFKCLIILFFCATIHIIKNKSHRQFYRVLTKSINRELDELDNKMMVYSPDNTPNIPGKCMMCNKDVKVVYVNDKHSIV